MEERVTCYGVAFAKDHFKNMTFHQFKDMYQFQRPYADMLPIDREKALIDTWSKLEPAKPVKEKLPTKE